MRPYSLIFLKTLFFYIFEEKRLAAKRTSFLNKRIYNNYIRSSYFDMSILTCFVSEYLKGYIQWVVGILSLKCWAQVAMETLKVIVFAEVFVVYFGRVLNKRYYYPKLQSGKESSCFYVRFPDTDRLYRHHNLWCFANNTNLNVWS